MTKLKLLKEFFIILVSFTICFGITCQIFHFFILLESKDIEKRIYSTATIDDNFSDENIIVIMNNKSSQAKNYNIKDFSEINCKSVTDLSQAIKKKTNKSIKNETTKLNSSYESFKQIYSLELAKKSKENVLDAIEKLGEREDIFYVGPDYEISLCSTPNDEEANKQWAINNLDLTRAWEINKGSNAIKVGVIDSGIDGTHPDLINRIDNTLCRDFSNGNNQSVTTPTDPWGHGTHVAGIIGAQGNNGIGTTGVCWDIKLISLRVFDWQGMGKSSYVAKAIDYAAMQNIPILNLSAAWTIPVHDEYYDTFLNIAISNYDGLVVCAAGNNGLDVDSNSIYPAKYQSDNLITVGASSEGNELCNFSNYGATTVDIFAPGLNIYSTVPQGYGEKSGTSMAAPFVTGVAALLLSCDNKLRASEIKNIILNSADKESAFSGKCVSGGRLNASKTLMQFGHIYDNKYENLDSEWHKAFCECGESIAVAHEYNKYEKYNTESHKLKCVCGAFKLQAHEWVQYVPLLSIDGNKLLEARAIEPNALGVGNYIQCKKCYFRKKVGDGEIIIVPINGTKYTEDETE